jgi:hypothetical protein
MKQLTSLFVFLLAATLTYAQQASTSMGHGSTAVYASANGDDSYLLFSNRYDPAKKYVVLKLWDGKEALTEREKTGLDYLKKFLQKKNIDVLILNWKDEATVQELSQKYNVTLSTRDDKHLNLHGGSYNMNTTAAKALVILEDGRPLSLCSGANCEDNAKRFFKLESAN